MFVSLLEQPMLDCARTRGPCSAKPPPPPPPCPKPPKKPFPWIYLIVLGAVVGLLAILYQIYRHMKKVDSNQPKPQWRPRPTARRPGSEKDLPKCVQYLIIGTGPAGWSAYEAIKARDKFAKVFFITKEDAMPYKRFPISTFMWWNNEPPDMAVLNYIENSKKRTMYRMPCRKFLDPVVFNRRKTGPAVSFASGYSVIRIDPDEHRIWIKTQSGERPMYYERALLAPGSKAKSLSILKAAPSFVRARVTTFRSLRDLEVAFRKVREAKHITIIGGGFLGAELSWYIARMHHMWTSRPDRDFEPVKITHVMKDAGMLASILPGYLAEWASERLKCENVTVIPKAQVYDFFESKDHRLQLTLSDGSSVLTDFAILCIGAEPREELAAPSCLELDPLNRGYVVNTEMEIRKHLYVAGDAASVYSQWKDTRLRFEHAVNAIETGTIAGHNMAGYWEPCNVEPYFEFTLGPDLQIEGVGEVGACMPTIALFKPCEDNEESIRYDMKRGEYGKPCFKQSNEYKNRYKRGILFYLRDETVVGVIFWNMTEKIPDRKEVVTEVLRARPSFQDINILADILGFHSTVCHYDTGEVTETQATPKEGKASQGPCIKRKKVW